MELGVVDVVRDALDLAGGVVSVEADRACSISSIKPSGTSLTCTGG